MFLGTTIGTNIHKHEPQYLLYLCKHNAVRTSSPTRLKKGPAFKFQTPEELQEAVDAYFDTEERPTLSGLALHLGLTRQSVWNYKQREEYSDIIQRAAQRVEKHYEELLIYEKNPTGVIFALKCGMGWREFTPPALPTQNDIQSQFQKDIEEISRLQLQEE